LDLERRVVGQSIRENITCGDLNGFLEEIVLQDDEAVVQGGSRVQNSLPVLKNLLHRGDAIVNVEVYIER
jgi:3-phosphoglycerate kinase